VSRGPGDAPPGANKKKDRAVAAEKSQNVQDVFLNHVRKSKTPVTIFLVNGVKLQGIITWFDNFSVLLRRDGHTQLVYKHAISTVMPGAPIQLFDASAAAPAAGGREGTGAAPPREGTMTLTREVNPAGT
jgi:host factor-I protein